MNIITPKERKVKINQIVMDMDLRRVILYTEDKDVVHLYFPELEEIYSTYMRYRRSNHED
jgi:hypothetical protein